MKILTIPLLLLVLSVNAQDIKDFNSAYRNLYRKVKLSKETFNAHLSGAVLLSSTVIKGELTNIKSLFSDSRLLETDAIKSLQATSGSWKFYADSTVIIVPYVFYYMSDSSYQMAGISRVLEDFQTKEVISGTLLPVVVCKMTVSECKVY